jgi:hypothetical protein
VPCIDFSGWLCSKIAAHDDQAVVNFVWRIVEANPGLGFGADGFRDHWMESTRKLLALPIGRFLTCTIGEAETELRATMILISIHVHFRLIRLKRTLFYESQRS